MHEWAVERLDDGRLGGWIRGYMHAWVAAWVDCWIHGCMHGLMVNSQVDALGGKRVVVLHPTLAPTSVENRIWEAGGRDVTQLSSWSLWTENGS